MKRNHHSKIPLKDGSDCTVSKVKSKNIPSNQLSEEIESSFSREIHASEDHLAKMQFKHPSKLPRVMSKEKDSSVGNVPEKKIESRNKGFSDHKNPHYNKNSRFEDSRYYSTDYDNRGDIPHKRTKETERDEEVSYHDKLYYKDSSRSENYKRTKEIEMDKRSHSGRPYYNAQFEDQNYYSANYNDRTDFSHKRTKEIEVDKRSHTGKPYYNTQFEDQNDCSANYNDRTDISHKRTKEIERDKRSRTEISDNYRPYDNARLRSEDPNYYSAGYDDSFDVSHKRTKEMERDRRGLIGDSNHRRPYYNEAISIEDENYLSIGHENQADVPHEKTKDRSGKRKLELQKENPSHTEIGYHSSINAHIPFHSETASVADCDRIPNATKIPDAGHEIYDEKSTMSKQLFWSRKKDFLHGYDNRAVSIEDEKSYVGDNSKNRYDTVLSFESGPDHKKDKEMIRHSKVNYCTNRSYDDTSGQEINDNVSLKNKFQNMPEERNNAVLPNQIFEDVQSKHSHKMIIRGNSLQRDRNYDEEQHEFHDQQNNTKIRKRHVAINDDDDDDDDFQYVDDKNFNRNANAEAVSNVKPLTINDAYTVAEVLLGPSKQRKSFTIDQQSSNAVVAESENLTIMGRKCWSKICFSVSWHSHAVTRTIQNSSVENREAILDTLPLGRPKDKSCWSKCLDLLGCFKHASAALELWNDSLKRIEGLQGTGVVSYFVFLRWLIALNLILFILYFLLVTLPHAAFYVLPLKDISIAPNESVITEEFLNKYDKPRPTEFKPKETKNSSLRLHSDDLFSNWGILLDNLPDNILDITLAYDKRNYTSAERRNFSEYCEARYRTEMENNTGGILSAMQDLLQGTGWLQSTILFLGYYPANEISYFGLVYNMPVAVIAVLFVSFVICLCMMIQYSSHGVHETILARKNDYLQYSNILFCSWDYCIEDRKSSVIRHNSILHEIKSTLAEERRKREIKEWSRGKKIKVYFLRTFINLFVIAALCSSYYLIYRVVNYQLEEMQLHRLNKPGVNTLFIQYLSPIVITGLNIFVPIIFNNIVRFEMYNTQTQINMALFRTVFLRLSSVFVLVGLLYQQITCEPRDMCGAGMSETCRSPICWETYVGQQLYKLAVTDFFVYVMMFILYDVPRDVIVRHFKNKVTQMVGRQVFDLPNQVLALVYSQTLCWLGVVYSPLLPAITVIKFIAIFYIKKQMVLKYCVPAPIPYKASRSNAMFMIILMLSFFTLMIIHGYSLSKVEPSPACSPFRHYFVMTEALSDTVLKRSTTFASIFNFFFSALFLIPAIILMCIAIYYYWTIVVAHRKMVKVLKAQIAIEGHDKQFLLNRLTEVAKGQFYK
ncbi:uncharacterized protein LOC129965911 isoform X1 [Argiope bruennichi]|uniref:uncharacterized protein LOC129965911 isoform X1 n=1 Tax=Argiope bruennichi TaxID=94029 RepID=UPI0024940542|nr:uncharacterized protein LOC129965911 isoform X1 [Argiope bruennichi]